MTQSNRPIYAMNNPNENLLNEIGFILDCGFDGIELTVEPPASYFTEINKLSLEQLSSCKIIHTRDDLEFASADRKKRDIAIETMIEAIQLCKKLGLTRINVHPHRGSKNLSKEEVFLLNVDALKTLTKASSSIGVELMLENQPPFTSIKEISEVLEAVGSDLYLLLDLAHAFCYGSNDEVHNYIKTLGSNIKHIHLSDNSGTRDEHLFPGYGKLNFLGHMELIDKYVDTTVALSLESFRIYDKANLREVTKAEREVMTRNALCFIRELS